MEDEVFAGDEKFAVTVECLVQFAMILLGHCLADCTQMTQIFTEKNRRSVKICGFKSVLICGKNYTSIIASTAMCHTI